MYSLYDIGRVLGPSVGQASENCSEGSRTEVEKSPSPMTLNPKEAGFGTILLLYGCKTQRHAREANVLLYRRPKRQGTRRSTGYKNKKGEILNCAREGIK